MLACGCFVVMTSVLSSGALTDLKFATSEPFAVAAVVFVMIRLKVQAASLAVSGWPSLHLRPSLILNVHVSLSSEVVHDVARYGSGASLSSSRVSVG